MSLNDVVTSMATKFKERPAQAEVGVFAYDPARGRMIYEVERVTPDVPPPATGMRRIYEALVSLYYGYGK